MPGKSSVKRINLALQGGGSHGAFTWGVLDRLLEDERIAIEGISGTSAGAMNAAVMANGYMHGGAEGAQIALEDFWRRISEFGRFNPVQHTWFDQMMTGWNMDYNVTYNVIDTMTRMISPYFFNPVNFNPLREALLESIDFETLHGCSVMKLFISATNVRTGKPKVFECPNITPEVLLASACIPFMSQAVEVNGEYYWDGGYSGNPAIWPLIYHCSCRDIVLVQINPIEREGVPQTSREIINRLNEITFNSSLIREMRAIDFVTRLLDRNRLSTDEYKRLLMHLIECDEEMLHLGASSKVNTDWVFFQHLKRIGRRTADAWLKAHFNDLNRASTLDIRETFL